MADLEGRLAKLLALVDAAGTPAEAELAWEKAQALAVNTGLDLEMARQKQRDRAKREQPIVEKVIVGEVKYMPRSGQWRGLPGNRFFAELMRVITQINDIKINLSHRSDYAICFGFPSDIEFSKALFTSLSLQMVRFCQDEIARGAHREVGENARVFKQSFYESFTHTVKSRLRAAKRDALAVRELADREAAALVERDMPDGTIALDRVLSGELVLRQKAADVDEFYKSTSTAQGSWRPAARRTHSYAGARAGRDAGERAQLRGTQALPSGRKQLG